MNQHKPNTPWGYWGNRDWVLVQGRRTVIQRLPGRKPLSPGLREGVVYKCPECGAALSVPAWMVQPPRTGRERYEHCDSCGAKHLPATGIKNGFEFVEWLDPITDKS